MPAVEQVRVILERTFGFPVAESDAQIVLDRLTELASKEAVEHGVHWTCFLCGASGHPGEKTPDACPNCGAKFASQ